MKSLKSIISKDTYRLEKEEPIYDKEIIIEWFENNFGQDTMQLISLLYHNEINRMQKKQEKLIEHQSKNAMIYSTVVFDKVREEMKKSGRIKQETFSQLECVLRMYIDTKVPYNEMPKDMQDILYITKFEDKEIENWKEGK